MKRHLFALLFTLIASPAFAQLPVCNWGDMIYRAVAGYSCLPYDNTAGKFLQGQGASAAPAWTFQAHQNFLLPTQATNTFLGNTSGSNASPTAQTVSNIFDTLGYDIVRPPTPGSIPYKSAVAPNNAWQVLLPGTSGQVLTSGGTVNPPYWATPAQIGLEQICTTVGALLYYQAPAPTSAWVCLSPGTANQALLTGGVGTNLTWGTVVLPTRAINTTAPLGGGGTLASDLTLTCTGCLTNTPAALTNVNDTNVTLTLGGAPATALLQATSLTLGWTGTLGVSRGGLGQATTATADRYLKGTGTVWGTSSGAASGTGTCGGVTFVKTLNSDAAPTCDTPAVAAAIKGHIFGLTTSNNGADPLNDIDFATGEAVSDDASSPRLMTLATAITKRLDASWAVGTNQGCLDGTESVAGTPDVSTWYFLWTITRTDTSVVDVLCSESSSSPTYPTNYTHKRLIGFVYNGSGGDIKAYTQVGNTWLWAIPTNDFSSAVQGTTALTHNLTFVPPLLGVEAHMRTYFGDSGAAIIGQIASGLLADASVTTGQYTHRTFAAGETQVYEQRIMVGVSGGFATVKAISNTANSDVSGASQGWFYPL